MSRQQSFMVDEEEISRHTNKRKKDKPWILWHNWRGANWLKQGRYRTEKEAQTVKHQTVRKYANFMWPTGKICQEFQKRYSGDKYLILHEKEGKPK